MINLFIHAAIHHLTGHIHGYIQDSEDRSAWETWWHKGQVVHCQTRSTSVNENANYTTCHGDEAFVLCGSLNITCVEFMRGNPKADAYTDNGNDTDTDTGTKASRDNKMGIKIITPVSLLLRDMVNLQRTLNITSSTKTFSSAQRSAVQTDQKGDPSPGYESGCTSRSHLPALVVKPPLHPTPYPTLPNMDIICELGSGHFATVYRARCDTQKDVAVKILRHRDQDWDDMAQGRFRREVHLAQSIHHENVVRILSDGELTDGSPYCVMELVEGGSLAERLVHGALDWRETVNIGIGIVDGLCAIHDAGIIHRDLKPENILISADGCPRISDLGMGQQIDERTRDRLTRTGIAMGTPVYMSPESVRDSHRVSAASDIYSFGVLLYELVCDALPVNGNSPVEIMRKHLKGELVALTLRRQDLPTDFVAIINNCLAYSPEDRPTCDQLANQLKAICLDTSNPARHKTNPRIVKMKTPFQIQHKKDPVLHWLLIALVILLFCALIAIVFLIQYS